LKAATGGGVIDYKVADFDRLGNLIVGGTCQDATICGTTAMKPIFESINLATLASNWVIYMRNTAGTDITPTDVMALSTNPSSDFFVVALKISNTNKVALVRMPTT
jgi:hypothetical protein